MGDTWVTDLTHFLREDGSIAPASGPARKLAEHLGSIVACVTGRTGCARRLMSVQCRRRPRRKKCPGKIEAGIDRETVEIIWHCPICSDNGYIRNWQGTMWDLTQVQEVH